MKEDTVAWTSPYRRAEYPVIVSLTISLFFILISLVGWWLRTF